MLNLSAQLERLKETKDSVERNALAIMVSETRDPSVQAALVALIDRPGLLDQRASFSDPNSGADGVIAQAMVVIP